jgi:hypothetical protein
MPCEIKYMILKYLDPCSATSLNLSCPPFYAVLKRLYPNPILVDEDAFFYLSPCEREINSRHKTSKHDKGSHYSGQKICGPLIRTWSGFAQYRLHRYFSYCFLNKAIYEDTKLAQLEQR